MPSSNPQMPHRGKISSLSRILGKLDGLDETSLAIVAQRLARERRLLETVFDIIRDAIVVTDPDGRIQYANQSAFELLGLRVEEIGKASLLQRLPLLAETLGIDSLEGFEEGKVATCETTIEYPDRREVQAYLVGIEAPLGMAERGVVVVMTDLTETKQITEEKIENERIASVVMLSAGVAHELGNPLNSLTIHLQLLERRLHRLSTQIDKEDFETMQKSLRVCRGEVKRLDEIIENFLGAVRPQLPELREVSLFQLLEQTLDAHEELFKEREIAAEVQIDLPLPQVRVDANQIKQVFYNVLKNALEAMKPGGRVVIRSRRNRDSVALIFCDDGEGIAQEDLSRVFQPYYSTKSGGHGLGMMVVQRIMKDHGGQIAVDSRPGIGTEVTLRFPLSSPSVPLLEESETRPKTT